jgi:hypothetical protein
LISGQLERLPFEDPILEEATEAYLYGFYCAAIILSASTLEHQLKARTGTDWLEGYQSLVEDAVARIGLTRRRSTGRNPFSWSETDSSMRTTHRPTTKRKAYSQTLGAF